MDLLKITLAAALTLAAAPAAAAPQVSGAWSRPAAAGTTGAGFLTLANPGRTADALVAVETPLARKVEIHRSTMRGGVSSMQKLERVDLPPGGRVVFAPGGHHLMLLGLKQPLKTGDRAPATLVFASGARVKTTFEVRIAPPSAAGEHHH
ncbi:copper chaperone PCu(A)C [Phenylobacterium sp.]|uniref:copper chaperone PCu(A)C n=1 Tax=Phenylobacterium sp. TaxID=1871053 RepID=UPI0028123197|nr:copper chaperone PCu(A)C [Phenylobacterium sp.]